MSEGEVEGRDSMGKGGAIGMAVRKTAFCSRIQEAIGVASHFRPRHVATRQCNSRVLLRVLPPVSLSSNVYFTLPHYFS